MNRFAFALAVLFSAIAPMIAASDRYVVQGSALGPPAGASLIRWTTDIFFFNPANTDARVRLVGISNGNLPTDLPSEFTIPANRSSALSANGAVATWQPRNPILQTLWVLHLDVPETVLLDDTMFIGEEYGGGAPTPLDYPYKDGKIRLPIFSALVPANQPQVHLATFLGSSNYIPSRTNVTIYNAGSDAATATIQIRDHCDDSLLLQTTVSIPANTIIQASGINAPAVKCAFDFGFTPPPSAVYTVVTVNQPSFSFVSNLSNRDLPLTSMSISQ